MVSYSAPHTRHDYVESMQRHDSNRNKIRADRTEIIDVRLCHRFSLHKRNMSPNEFRIVNYANECLLQLTHRNATNIELGVSKKEKRNERKEEERKKDQ